MSNRRNNEFLSIKEVMENVLGENKLQKGIDLVLIKEAWAEVMGSGVVSYTTDVQFRNGILTVKLNSSVLREELSYGKEKIVKLLNEKLNKMLIKSVKLN
ncbi:DUF721 domain-containing protein [Aureibaculum sp. A20]|uniref:DUF721 domain-containing protein n=1 Tax=Aureibaculum flavum TaxID=2795986 RepID=A0ABS0WTE1_9FLAO|nr:DUF721 domain-containing protein [Aureibaculum flavum]MBJ2175260.1 DUF721 domain-containing protein [Aureibaculum flavum]